MKKNFLLWMGVVLIMVIGMSSCSSDDGIESFDHNVSEGVISSENIIGTWQLLKYSGGLFGRSVDINPGEITFTFTKDGKVNIINKRREQYPFATCTCNYSFVTNDRSIFTGEKETALSIGGGIFHYTYSEGMLCLAEEMYDGYCYALKKIGR